jgi:hypothetical protein
MAISKASTSSIISGFPKYNNLIEVSSTPRLSVEYLIVGGGGGGSKNNYAGCGGGGGGFIEGIFYPTTGTSYTLTVGNGGTGGTSANQAGTDGQSSSIFGFTAGGGNGDDLNSNPSGSPQLAPWGLGSSDGESSPGGGGAGGPSYNIDGGPGLPSSISGNLSYYGGGGGGGKRSGSRPRSAGGTGGGGAGSDGGGVAAVAGSSNTGGGGGGGASSGGNAANGGSGVVVIAYPDFYPALTSITAGLAYSQPSRTGYRVYSFYGAGQTGTIVF